MENTKITKDNQEKINKLLENIKNLTQEQFKKIMIGMNKFHDYSVGNQIILNLSGASQVAGFKAWNKHKRFVKKGAKAIWILAPSGQFTVNKDKDDERLITSFRSAPVYDIIDTKGEPIKRGMTTISNINLDKMKSVALKLGYQVNFIPLNIACGGMISEKQITLNSNLDNIENVGTLIHEISHGELGHTKSSNISTRDIKEQEAETLTYLICQKLEINRNSEYYLKAWNIDTKDIKISLNNINESFNKIIDKIEEDD